MDKMVIDLTFYKGKRVLITGHTGFKGSWLSTILLRAGAEVFGYSLAPPTDPNLFDICKLHSHMDSTIGDICDEDNVLSTVLRIRPEIVFHLAAQPIVRESYRYPVKTFQTNVMGTVHILEATRQTQSIRSLVNVTTDKVYENFEWHWGYRETDILNGYDPYSNSKSCSELVTQSYQKAFLHAQGVAVSTARAGNVIGGGDFAVNRIIPDCVRAVQANEVIMVRNSYSVRPYQHVLDPIFMYLIIGKMQYENSRLSGSYNIGPDDCDCVKTGELVDLFCSSWGSGASWENNSTDGPHEASFLKLDCSKAKSVFGWKPRWHIVTSVDKTVEWTKAYLSGKDMFDCMHRQIENFMGEGAKYVVQ